MANDEVGYKVVDTNLLNILYYFLDNGWGILGLLDINRGMRFFGNLIEGWIKCGWLPIIYFYFLEFI